MSTTLKDSACMRLSSSGLRQSEVHRIIDDVDRWNRQSGSQWTCDRLKAIKLEAVSTWAGNPVKADWVRRNRKGRLAGVWGRLVASTTARSRQRALNALMIYSTAIDRRPSAKALEKFEGSAFRAPETVTRETLAEALMQPPNGFNTVGAVMAAEKAFREMSRDARPYLPTSPTRRVPLGSTCIVGLLEEESPGPPVREFGVPRSCSEQDVATWLKAELHSPVGIVLSHDTFFRTWLNSLAGPEGVVLHPTFFPPLGREKRPPLSTLERCPIGKIGYIPEPGLKLRGVANPSRLLQTHLTPLKEFLMEGLRSIPQDCTFNQDAGVATVQGWLRMGETVHCIDLSDATNHWPLEHTLGVLDRLPTHLAGLDDQLEVWRSASRGLWETLDGSFQRWSRGQPLGLGPSFAAFATSHHSVVQDAFRRSGEDPRYVILGDDIAMVGNGAVEEYRRSLEGMDVPVSDHKCLSSSKIAEFAGRIISSDEVLVAPKWREQSDRSFLDYVRVLGPSAVHHLRPRQRRVASALLAIPEEYGGLGMNPMGLPLADRISLGEALRSVSDSQVYDLAQRRATRVTAQVRMGVPVTRAPSWMLADRNSSPARGSSERTDKLPVRARVERNLRVSPIRVPEGQVVPPDYVKGVSTSDPRGPSPLASYERKLREAKRVGAEFPLPAPVSKALRKAMEIAQRPARRRWHSSRDADRGSSDPEDPRTLGR